jgi:hypothetical protein
MRSALHNFLKKMARALVISADEARDLARAVLAEPSQDDDADLGAGLRDLDGRAAT